MGIFKGGCKACQALQEHNRYLKKIIDSLLQHVGADKVMQDMSLGEQIPKIVEHEEGSDDPPSTYGD